MEISLYIHYPFCLSKCHYCAFNSVSDAPCSPDEYLQGLLREMELRSAMAGQEGSPTTLYFGGGTPSLLEPSRVAQLITTASRLFNLSSNAEITLECNPGTVTRDSLTQFKAAGINRLSIGIQSFDDRLLQVIGRTHTASQGRDALAAAREAGFDNVGIDIIHSLPEQTAAMWERELELACTLRPDHMSVYGLTVEEGTVFAAMENEGRLQLPDEDESAIMYERSSEILSSNGYEHYEIANLARPGFRSRHNIGYWQRRPFLGFGAGAHSFLRHPGCEIRLANTGQVKDYLFSLSNNILPITESRTLSREEAMAEWFFLGLRMTEGVDLDQFREEFAQSFDDVFGPSCSSLFTAGMLEISDGFLRLSPKARVVSNQVFQRFI